METSKKLFGFLAFPGSIETKHWAKMGLLILNNKLNSNILKKGFISRVSGKMPPEKCPRENCPPEKCPPGKLFH